METLTLFKLMDAKLAYATQRQGVLANNIANANTPGYKSFDVKAPDFKALMQEDAPINKAGDLELTNAKHIPLQSMDGVSAKADIDKTAYEVSPDGNSVDVEEQMMKASRNNTEASIVTSLYAKQLAFLKMAVGGGSR